MGIFGKNKPQPVTPNPVVGDDGFVDHKAKPYHCWCGHEEKTSTAMDSHVNRAHSRD